MQIATSGAPAAGSGRAPARIRPSSASAVVPSPSRARSPSTRGAAPARGPSRAIAQKPLR